MATVREILLTYIFGTDEESRKKAEKSIDKVASYANKALGAIGIAFSISGLSKLKTEFAEAASNVEQMQMKFDTVFAECSQGAEEWADSFASAIGRNKSTIKTYMADNQNLLTGFGMARDEAAGLTEAMIKAAIDLASFNNIEDDVAINAMSKAMMGESEAAKTLGAVLNDNTRAEAMATLGIKGKYEQLDQLTKMQVNYQAILNQSKDSIDDAINSVDTYEGSSKALNAAIQETKEVLGSFLLPILTKANKAITPIVKNFTGWLRTMSAVSDKSNVFTRRVTEIKSVVTNVIDKVNKVVKVMGGWEKVLKVLAIAAGIFIAAIGFKKIADGLKLVTKLLNPAYLKIMAIVAIVLVLAAIIEDFINFMQGNDSVIGELFKRAGIDADEMRAKIIDVWTNVKSTLLTIWNALKSAGIQLFNGLKIFWEKWGDTILQFFSDIWRAMCNCIQPFLDFLDGLCAFLSGVFSGNWEQAWEGLKQMFLSFAQFIAAQLSGLQQAFDNLGSAIFGPMLDKMKEGFENVKAWFKSLPSMARQWMHDFVDGLINGIKEKMGEFVDSVKDIGQNIKDFLHFSVPDKGPLTDYETWMPDFMQGLARGIKDNIPLIRSAVEDASKVMAMFSSATPQSTASIVAGSNTTNRVVNQNNEYNINVKGTDNQAVNNAANTIKQSAVDNTGELARALVYTG